MASQIWDQMVAILLTTISNVFSWMKMHKFVCSQGFNQQYSSFGSEDGLAPANELTVVHVYNKESTKALRCRSFVQKAFPRHDVTMPGTLACELVCPLCVPSVYHARAHFREARIREIKKKRSFFRHESAKFGKRVNFCVYSFPIVCTACLNCWEQWPPHMYSECNVTVNGRKLLLLIPVTSITTQGWQYVFLVRVLLNRLIVPHWEFDVHFV